MNAYEKKETILSLENISLNFGIRKILRDINAKVQDIVRPDCTQGQVICFLGPSGIGKTQLSRIIAGLQAPTTGRVLLGEKCEPTQKGKVGMVPQNYPLFEFVSVQENFLIAGQQAGLPKIVAGQKAANYIEKFGLSDYLKLYPSQISGGTRQRVSIVRQLMCSEHFLLMDEPFSGLDLIMKQRACSLIQEVASMDELNTIIVVTHDVTEGMSIADTVWLMGQEQKEGKWQDGATLVDQIDLAAMDLCWTPDIIHDQRFMNVVSDVKERFTHLKEY